MKSPPETANVLENSTRQCAVGRERRDKSDLIRFVLAPDMSVTPDIHRKLPGRGVWITASRDRVARAVQTKAFARSFKAAVIADAGLDDRVGQLLRQAALQSLAIANKAGLVVAGFGKVEALALKGKAVCLVHASEAAEDGCRKLAAALGKGLEMRAIEARATRPVIGTFHTAELGRALGSGEAVHVALRKGGATDTFMAAATRLTRYEDGGPFGSREEQDSE